MIMLNERSHFGSRAVVRTDAFNCMISTAPGLFKGSTLVMQLGSDGTVRRMPMGKAYLKRTLSKADREAVHDHIVDSLDRLGGENFSLVFAIEGAFSIAKARGLILDYIVDRRERPV